MILAKVKGNLVSTHKNHELKGEKLLITQPVDFNGNFIGEKELIAIDHTDAGIGDIVLISKEGAAVGQILGHNKAPVNAIIVAIVDDIHIES